MRFVSLSEVVGQRNFNFNYLLVPALQRVNGRLMSCQIQINSIGKFHIAESFLDVANSLRLDVIQLNFLAHKNLLL